MTAMARERPREEITGLFYNVYAKQQAFIGIKLAVWRLL
jgi:hypothetical protein